MGVGAGTEQVVHREAVAAMAADAEAPVPPPPVKLTVGADVYPLPPEVMATAVTSPFPTTAVAEAPLPPPPVNTRVGALV